MVPVRAGAYSSLNYRPGPEIRGGGLWQAAISTGISMMTNATSATERDGSRLIVKRTPVVVLSRTI